VFIEYLTNSINMGDVMLCLSSIPNTMSRTNLNMQPDTNQTIRGITLYIIDIFNNIADAINNAMYISMQVVIDNILRFTW